MQLEAIATRMFADRGFEAVTVDEIVAAADVSHRTFYRYFPSKEDVLLGDHQAKVDAFVAAVRARPADESAFDALRAAVLDFADGYEQDQDRNATRARVVHETPCLAQRVSEKQLAWEQALTPVLAERIVGVPDADLQARLMVACALGVMRAAIDRWIAVGPARSLRDLVDESFETLANGFAPASPPASPR